MRASWWSLALQRFWRQSLNEAAIADQKQFLGFEDPENQTA
jgi:hypothetical protein